MQHPAVNLKLAHGSFHTRVAGKRLYVSCSLGAAVVVYTPWFPLVQADPPFFSFLSSDMNLSCYVMMKQGIVKAIGSC